MERQIQDILAGRNVEAKEASHPTLFHEILSSHLPPEELTLMRLQNEAMGAIGAGVETTKWALGVGCYHILANPDIERRLRRELSEKIPDPKNIPHWMELEKLPFLNAVVAESMSGVPPPIRQDTLSRSHQMANKIETKGYIKLTF